METWNRPFALGHKPWCMWRGFNKIWTCINRQFINLYYFLKVEIRLIYLKYLPLSLITKLTCKYYVRVSTYLFSFFVSEHQFLFQCLSRACVYLFIILVFKHIFGFFQWLSSSLGNLFRWNLFSNRIKWINMGYLPFQLSEEIVWWRFIRILVCKPLFC